MYRHGGPDGPLVQFNVGAGTDMADLTARWFNFNVGATDMADLTARAGGAIRLPNPGIAAIHLLFLAFSNAAISPL
ncbi:MAG: hypothetical protein H6562_20230 [Lewinellaceae bacterium]|nr:hypothetical protein [Lewinellaceae bacterium]